MRLIEALKSGALDVPWPLAVDGAVFPGKHLPVSEVCERRCGTEPKCAATPLDAGEYVCEFGMSFFRSRIGDTPITIFGVKGPSNQRVSDRHLKPALKGRSVDASRIDAWAERVEHLLAAIEAEFVARQSEMLDPLHDPTRLARQIEVIASRLLEKQFPNQPEDVRLERADSDTKSLLKAARLLSESFDLLKIYFNPAAASYGRRKLTSLHGLLMKLICILRIQDEDPNGSNVRILFVGQSYKRVHIFESFTLVPFALISNAVKYSLEGVVRVEIIERQKSVEVIVESQGPWIEPDEIPVIFAKRGRGRWGRQVADGTGVGLYLAQVVAAANGSEIRVSSSRTGAKTSSSVPLATNRFSFELAVGVGT